DFANFSANGRYSSIGFGSIDQTPNQRTREELLQYDFISNLNLGQLAPSKWGLQIPLSFSSGETFITPKYDPFYQDLKLEDRLETSERRSQRDSIRNQAIDYTNRKSVSLIGVRKNPSGNGIQRFYSPENFDFSYAYNKLEHRDFEIEKQEEINLLLGANYGHSFNTKTIEPFKKIKFFNRKRYWRWLQQFNFNLLPNSLEGSINVNRILNNQKFRQVYLEGTDASLQRSLPSLQQRNFLFDYNYSLSHNITRSLRFNFNAATSSIIRQNDQNFQQDNSNILWRNLLNSGEPNTHFQSLALNYKLPLQNIPFLSFIDAAYSYVGNFNWQRGSEALAEVKNDDGLSLGIVNTIQNNNKKTLTGAISFSKLYSALGLRPNIKRPSKNTSEVINKDSIRKNNTIRKSLTKIIDALATLKRIQFNYNENNGTVLPGYLPSVRFAGGMQPTLGFTIGSQADIRYEAARKGWLTGFPNFNQLFTQLRSNKFLATAQMVPLKGLIIDLNAERDFAENKIENFSINNSQYYPQNSNISGNFGVSTIMIKTAFNRSDGQGSTTFNEFRKNRTIIANRLYENTNFSELKNEIDGYPFGYGKNQQSVLLYSFIAAYSGIDPYKINLNPIKQMPLPNWNLKLTALSKIRSFSKIFNRFSINHAYRASYTLNNFQTNFDYDPTAPFQTDKLGNYIPERLYSNINLVEQFNPLARIDMEFKNSIKILAEFRKERAISLSLDNNLITETLGDEYIVGLGYRLKDVRFRTNISGRRVILSGDLNVKIDVSYRNNLTLLKNLEYDNNQVTAGQKLMAIKVTADYALTKNLTALFFYDHNFSEFAISTAFPQTSIRSGFTIRYNFGN
ncbi:MAG: cell surface protein SprA, partial [Bacteroidota bacterium]|nr:cell surface protein SprA [Bacteroidota bacterium]